ncbi:MAG: hypothetical protein MJ188_02520 [Treponema sp.]|nr:hypothetical protein [Treponema sp.]
MKINHTNIFHKKTILFFSLFFLTLSPFFSQEQEVEIPQGLKDARRFEIITLGAMPFVTLDATLIYSFYQEFQKPQEERFSNFNPFGSSSYNNEEVFGIVITSFGVCLGIGLTDLAINILKRKKNALQQESNRKNIEIQEYSIKELDSMLEYPSVRTNGD